MIINGDHRADMADVTRHLERAGRVARLAFSQSPPVAVINEDVPDFDLTADEFHRGTIVNL